MDKINASVRKRLIRLNNFLKIIAFFHKNYLERPIRGELG